MRRLDDQRGAVRVEDVYDTGIDDLWSALTEPERLARWIAEVEGDLKVGGHIHVIFTSTAEGPGRVDVCEAPHRLLVTMRPGMDDEGVIEAMLDSEGDKTRLVIEQRGLPLEVLYRHGAGWQAHAEDLANYLAGGDSQWKARWDELSPTYEALAIA
jgi:uncharacterized protein YndB with AHSA1/START domain